MLQSSRFGPRILSTASSTRSSWTSRSTEGNTRCGLLRMKCRDRGIGVDQSLDLTRQSGRLGFRQGTVGEGEAVAAVSRRKVVEGEGVRPSPVDPSIHRRTSITQCGSHGPRRDLTPPHSWKHYRCCVDTCHPAAGAPPLVRKSWPSFLRGFPFPRGVASHADTRALAATTSFPRVERRSTGRLSGVLNPETRVI